MDCHGATALCRSQRKRDSRFTYLNSLYALCSLHTCGSLSQHCIPRGSNCFPEADLVVPMWRSAWSVIQGCWE